MKKIIAANWKMNLSVRQSLRLARSLAAAIKKEGLVRKADILVFPDFLSLPEIASLLGKVDVKLGAQDCAASGYGPHTGQTAATSLKVAGARYVICGHSERRALGEDDAVVRAKAIQAISAGLVPVICLGEPAGVREKGKQLSYVRAQLLKLLAGGLAGKFILAYEPIWAIGTGKSPNPTEVSSMHQMIYEEAERLSGRPPRVIYGGSVDASKAKSFLSQPHIDGLLIGGASLKVASFLAICRQA